MNTLLHLREDNHQEFVSNFLQDKKFKSEQNIISPSKVCFQAKDSDIHDSANAIENEIILPVIPSKMKISLDESPKLAEMMRLDASPRHSLKKNHYQHITDLKKLPPLLLNNLKFFIKKVRRIGYMNDLSALTPYDLAIINDHADYENEKIGHLSDLQIFIKRFYSYIELSRNFLCLLNPLKKIPIQVIHPYNKFKLLWDMFNALVIILLLFYIPLAFSFGLYDHYKDTEEIFIMGIFIGDMMLEMNTLYFKYGVEVNDRKQILLNYLSSYFLVDFLSLLALTPIAFSFNGFAHFLFLLKFFTLDKIGEKMMNRFQVIHKKKGIKDLIYLFFVIVFITHFLACAWYYIGNMRKFENNWIKEHDLENQDWKIQYMTSFYWSIVTVMTVGYGDITPQNNIETCFCLFTILFGCMIFPYSINSVGIIIQDIKKDHIKFK